MSKPLVGVSYIEKCPKCNFNKLHLSIYKNKTKYKCPKCNYIWEVVK